MKLIILTQYYPPEIGAPQRRLSELAERIVRAGHSVTVLTAMPNYPQGRIHKGYKGFVKREWQDGVEIIHTFIYPTQKTSLIHRLSNYFSFMISSAIIGSFLLKRADFLLVESPPLFLGLSAFWLSWLKRSRLIFNVSDLWPESAVRLGVVREGGIAHRVSSQLEKLCYQVAWLVTGQSQSILSDIQRRFSEKTTFLLSNGVDVGKFTVQSPDQAMRAKLTDGENQCVFLYAGLHGLAQGLSQIIEAVEKLSHQENIRFVLVGDGPEKSDLMANAENRNLKNILFLASVPAHEVPHLLSAADVLLVTLKEYIPGAVPSKLYEAMATGKPVLLVATGEPADIVTRYQAGLVVEPGKIDDLVKNIEALAHQPELRRQFGIHGRQAVEEAFNRDKIAEKFIHYLEEHR